MLGNVATSAGDSQSSLLVVHQTVRSKFGLPAICVLAGVHVAPLKSTPACPIWEQILAALLSSGDVMVLPGPQLKFGIVTDW